ncbi:MAG TPA: hypothetical protein VH740_03900 [Vicinamibacterales bacterium]
MPRMPPTKEGLGFLQAFTEYVDWRIHHKGRRVMPGRSMRAFGTFLQSRGARVQSDTYKSLMARMYTMKDGRSTDRPPPK